LSGSDRRSSVFFLVLSIFVLSQSFKQKLGGLHKPGPGFLPFLASLAMGILSLALLASTWSKHTERSTTSTWRGIRWVNIAVSLAALFAFAYSLEMLGFLVSTTLFMALLLRLSGRHRWYIVIGIAVGTALVAHLVFSVWLGLRLPVGFLGWGA
jgi:putative tricarboxylic transport membrane protein